jgi:hypothetical protein
MDSTSSQPQTPNSVPPTAPITPAGPPDNTPNEEWLQNFYKECGREVTLAYTTLNQMKNWAMIVAAAAISGVAFSTSALNYPNEKMYVGVVIVYTFILRFFIRAIICYINLTRWNRLQNDCLQYGLLPHDNTSSTELLTRLQSSIENYYFRWRSPIDRKTQLFSNLKLGFGLLLALPLFFLIWGVSELWASSLVQALTVFAVGTTIVEFNDFFKSPYFDNIRAYDRRKQKSKAYEIFPVPASRGWYLATWVVVVCLSVTVALVSRSRRVQQQPATSAAIHIQGTVQSTSIPDAEIAVSSVPNNSEVWLDGVFVGFTPSTLRMHPGKKQLRIMADKYDVFERDVTVLSNSQVTFVAHLVKARRSTQPDAPGSRRGVRR